MKITLIHPSSNQYLKVPPLGLAYLSANSKKTHFEIEIIDCTNQNNAKESGN